MTRWMVRTLLAVAAVAAAALAPRLNAPEPRPDFIPPARRLPQTPAGSLVVLVDVSGSMSNRGKLDHARQAVRDLNARMGPMASPTVIAYADRAHVLVAPGEVLDDAQLDLLLSTLSAKGSSNLYDGLRLADTLTASHVQVVVITDGPANAGVVDPARFAQLVGGMGDRSARVSTVVLDPGASSELDALATAGGGWSVTTRHPRDLTLDLRRHLDLSGGAL